MSAKKAVEFMAGCSAVRTGKEPLRQCVGEAVDNYFSTLDGHATNGLYKLVLKEVEAPLLEAVLRQTRGNQTRAAEVLGLNRGTLRKKLREYGLD